MCITQFQNEDEISFDKLKDAGGLENILELCYPILKPGAFHTVFPPLPLNLSTKPAVRCKDPSKRAAKVKNKT